jgi:type II secretory pathway pseudopilin PulG
MRSGKEHGFTYLSVVILVATIGLVTAATLRMGVVMQRAAAEQELLRIGAEFSDALQSYAAATPPGQPAFPPSLKELLKDPRFPQVRRHLRRIYVDPMTGKPEWGLIRTGVNKPGQPGQPGMPGQSGQPGQPGQQSAPFGGALSSSEGGIIGIYSLSTEQPIKISNFPERFVSFEGKASISDWKFTAETGRAPVVTAVKPGAPGTPPNMPAPPVTPGQTVPPGQSMPQPKPAPQEPPQEAPPEPPPEPPPTEPEKAEPEPAAQPPGSGTNEPIR